MATFTNQASLSYNGITVNSNIVTGELTPTLAVTKTATTETYTPDGDLTYVLTLRNTGTLPFTGLTVSDDLGAFTFGAGTLVPLTYTGEPVLYYVDGVLQASPTVTAGPPMVITGINVPAGSNAALVYRANVNDQAPLGTTGSIVNTATVTGAGLTTPAVATDTITADTATRLAIQKALDPQTVNENGNLTYTFTLQNFGDEADAAANTVITDIFNPLLQGPLTVTLDGVALPLTTGYTYNEATGLFSTVPGQITVPAATWVQDPTTGVWTVNPGTATVTVTGRI